MRDYQIHGLNWLISLYENGINGILADEMVDFQRKKKKKKSNIIIKTQKSLFFKKIGFRKNSSNNFITWICSIFS